LNERRKNATEEGDMKMEFIFMLNIFLMKMISFAIANKEKDKQSGVGFSKVRHCTTHKFFYCVFSVQCKRKCHPRLRYIYLYNYKNHILK